MDGNWYVRRGRIGRRTYWLQYALPLTGAYVLATVLDVAFGLSFVSTHSSTYYSSDYYSSSYTAMYSAGPIALITSLALLAPSISALVTRLHDRGHSAHWLWFLLLPIAGPITLLITAGFLAGDPGVNSYGSPEGAVAPPQRAPAWNAPTYG
jgi:uncharacterized membrane protein YhaH (DUF805 family)